MPCVTALYVPPCCVTQCTSPFPAQDIQVMYIYQSLFQVGPPGHFKHISITTPTVTALKNYYR